MPTMLPERKSSKETEEGGARIAQLDSDTRQPIKSSDELGLEGHEQEVQERINKITELLGRLSQSK